MTGPEGRCRQISGFQQGGDDESSPNFRLKKSYTRKEYNSIYNQLNIPSIKNAYHRIRIQGLGVLG